MMVKAEDPREDLSLGSEHPISQVQPITAASSPPGAYTQMQPAQMSLEVPSQPGLL